MNSRNDVYELACLFLTADGLNSRSAIEHDMRVDGVTYNDIAIEMVEAWGMPDGSNMNAIESALKDAYENWTE